MEKRTCIIVDDEPAAHYVLANYISRNANLELVKQCYNGIETMDFLRENKVDLMFLDINMPEITGLEILKIIPFPPKTILTTAYSEFALESYEYGVIDYLLKPIYFPRFLKAIERFFNVPEGPTTASESPESISVKVDGEQLEIPLQQLLYAQSYGNYVRLFLQGRTLLASMTTNELEKGLPESRFLRIHKSYIVALDKTKIADKDHVKIHDAILPIGITYRRELMEKIKP